jgi:hypothetical protein
MREGDQSLKDAFAGLTQEAKKPVVLGLDPRTQSGVDHVPASGVAAGLILGPRIKSEGDRIEDKEEPP